jgi:predicted metal-dependent phosphoesterase TrpH
MLRADLHVHSHHSGLNGNLPFLRSRDCYSSPEDVYRTARANGMDLVTITDHDSVAGCVEILERHPDAPDFIVGEEISCWWPGVPLAIHVGAYGTTEAVHREVQPLRRNVREVIACLRERSVISILNHPLHFFRWQVPLDQFLRLLSAVDGVEVRNGTMLAAHNVLTERLLGSASRGCAAVGGSDAHTLRRVGRTWTEAPASTREEFLACLRTGRTSAGGAHGTTIVLARDIYAVVARYWLSLLGIHAPGLEVPRRAFGIAFSLASMPFELAPLLVSWIAKRRERAVVAAVERELGTHEWEIAVPGPEDAA